MLGVVGPLVKKIKERNQAHSQVQHYQGLLFRNPFTGNYKQSSAMTVGDLTVAVILLEYFRCETGNCMNVQRFICVLSTIFWWKAMWFI